MNLQDLVVPCSRLSGNSKDTSAGFIRAAKCSFLRVYSRHLLWFMQTVTGPSDDYGRDLTQELRSLSAVQAESTRRTCTVFLRPPAVVCVIGPGSDTVLRRGSSAFSLTMRILDYKWIDGSQTCNKGEGIYAKVSDIMPNDSSTDSLKGPSRNGSLLNSRGAEGGGRNLEMARHIRAWERVSMDFSRLDLLLWHFALHFRVRHYMEIGTNATLMRSPTKKRVPMP